MVYALTWLPDILQKAGLKVAEVTDWRTRGRAEMGVVRGVMVHHTAGSPKGNMPTLDLLVKGRPDLAGPLAQLGLGRDGTFYVVAAGKCNHAGAGAWRGVTTGNSSFIGIEAENTGRPGDAWPAVQLDALRRGVAAILAYVQSDSTMVCGHKEYALPAGRKDDPLFSMPDFREQVADLLGKGVPSAPLIPARDAQSRPTLRRGATGPLVTSLQATLGVETLGIFGPKTEAAVRDFQRDHAMTADGIVGPKTWAAIDMAASAGSAPATVATVDPPIVIPSMTRLAGNVAAASPATVTAPAVAATAPASPSFPIPDDAAHPVRIDGVHALTPDGRPFARRTNSGWFASGVTSIPALLAKNSEAGAGIPPSHLAIVSAVSGNEGKLEAINSYDNAFLSFGVMQWTLGSGDAQGELAALLARVRTDDASAYQDCFVRFGLDLSIAAQATSGGVVLSGVKIASASDKAQFRSPEWAYRFWRAGNHPSIRRSQIRHAVARIDRFSGIVVRGYRLSDWLSSELGMALLLDQHVNRPGHVPATIARAITDVLGSGKVGADPSSWSDTDEHQLIEHYLALRAQTSMTNSQSRANQLFGAAQAGLLKSTRRSFSI